MGLRMDACLRTSGSGVFMEDSWTGMASQHPNHCAWLFILSHYILFHRLIWEYICSVMDWIGGPQTLLASLEFLICMYNRSFKINVNRLLLTRDCIVTRRLSVFLTCLVQSVSGIAAIRCSCNQVKIHQI